MIKVLLIDNDMTLEQKLSFGFSFCETEIEFTPIYSKQALENLDNLDEYACVLLDLVIEGRINYETNELDFDGLEFVEIIEKKRKDLKILLITGHDIDDTFKSTWTGRSSISDVVAKPFDIDKLVEKIKKETWQFRFKELQRKGDLKRVFEYLNSLADDLIPKDQIALKEAHFNRLTKNNHLGTLNDKEYQVELNKIVKALPYLIKND